MFMLDKHRLLPLFCSSQKKKFLWQPTLPCISYVHNILCFLKKNVTPIVRVHVQIRCCCFGKTSRVHTAALYFLPLFGP